MPIQKLESKYTKDLRRQQKELERELNQCTDPVRRDEIGFELEDLQESLLEEIYENGE